MVLVWLIHILIILGLTWKFQVAHRGILNRNYFWSGIVAKILGGFAFGLLYKFFDHGGDTWNFFERSNILAQWAATNPLTYIKSLLGGPTPELLLKEIGYSEQPRALLMVKIVSFFSLITGHNYWISSAYFSLLSFFGVWTLVKRIAETYPESGKGALASFIFLPSALFWGSGISKEAIYMGGFGFLVAWFWPWFSYSKNKSPQIGAIYWLPALLILLLLFQLKYYYVVVLVPVLAATLIQQKTINSESHWLFAHFIWLLVFGVFLFGASWLHPNLRFDYIAQLVKSNAAELAGASSNQALIHFKDNPDPVTWMAINLPWATFSGLLRPNLGDWGSWFQGLAIAEHVLITIFMVGRIKSISRQDLQRLDWLPCIVYVLILSGLLTLSTPNFGTLVRYKVSYLPVLVFLLLYRNQWWDRLVSRLP